jgi:hypothetical protein
MFETIELGHNKQNSDVVQNYQAKLADLNERIKI